MLRKVIRFDAARHRGKRFSATSKLGRALVAILLGLVSRLASIPNIGFVASRTPSPLPSSKWNQDVNEWEVRGELLGARGALLASSNATIAAASAAVAVGAAIAMRVNCKTVTSSATCRATSDDPTAAGSVGVVLLSAGVGKRMGANIPKQYMKLLGVEIALHSLEVFLKCSRVSEIVIVVADEWRSVFEEHIASRGGAQPLVKYASGGAERQDSVNNGLALITSEFAAVHDAARPLVTVDEVEKVIQDAQKFGAALLAVQTKATIKQAVDGEESEVFVASTPDRKALWEAHTPQVIRTSLLHDAFENAVSNNLEVTDDVSLVESLGKPVKITEGEYTNIKVTTPEDIAVAETILRSRGFQHPSE